MSHREHAPLLDGTDDSETADPSPSLNTRSNDLLLDTGRDSHGEVHKPVKNWTDNDRYYLVYILFCIQGCAVLLPFNAYINCPDYFISLFGAEIMTEISSVYMALNFGGMILMTAIQSYVPAILAFVIPYIFFIITLVLIAILTGWLHLAQGFAQAMVLVVIAFTGLATAFLQAGIFGKAYTFPSEKISQAVMAGNGIIGILVSITRIITKVTLETSESFEGYRNAALLYFALASAFMIFGFCTYFLLYVIPYSRTALTSGPPSCLMRCFTRCLRRGSVMPGGSSPEFLDIDDEQPDGMVTGALVSSSNLRHSGGPETSDDRLFLAQKQSWWDRRKEDGRIYLHALKINFHNALYLFGIFFVSLSVFPGLSSVIPTSFPTTWMKDWFSVIITSLFTLFDWIGRQLPGFAKLDTRKWIWAVVLARFAFIVLFWLCIHPVWWLHHDIIPFSMMVIMAFTNGYFSTVVMMDATSRGSRKSKLYAARVLHLQGAERARVASRIEEVSGVICTTFMVGGICIGSWCSMALFEIQKAIYE